MKSSVKVHSAVRVFLAVAFLAATSLFAAPRQASAKVYELCNGGHGPLCQEKRACLGVPGSDVSICFISYAYIEYLRF